MNDGEMSVFCPGCNRPQDIPVGEPFVFCDHCGYCTHPAALVNPDGSEECEVCGVTYRPNYLPRKEEG